MGFLIDTSLWIAVERGKLSAADFFALTKQEPIYVSPINLAELRFGIELMTVPAQKQHALALLRRMRRKPLIRITGETAEVFGALAARLHAAGRGHAFRVQDLWLAAQAVERDLTLLTANFRDFEDIFNLKVVSFPIPA